MPRSPSTYSLPPGTTPQQPNTVISSSMFNAFADDVAQTFNTVQPIVYGGTGSNDLKLTDTDFGIKDNGDPTKIGQFNASNLPTATTRTYDLPYYSGTLGLVSDIRGQIYGLTLSNNVTDATNDIDIAAGSVVDSTGAVSILLASGLTKRADATWVVGTNQGGRFYTTLADGTIHFYVIRNPTTGVVDAGFSDNATNPTAGPSYPAGFSQYARVGSFNRVTGAIVRFTQRGNRFYLDAPTRTITATNPGTSAVTRGFTYIPGGGISVIAMLQAGGSNLATSWAGLITPLTAPNTTPSGSTFNVQPPQITGGATVNNAFSYLEVVTDTSAQVRTRISSSGAGDALLIVELGWIDPRI